jgi:hypothetical protein
MMLTVTKIIRMRKLGIGLVLLVLILGAYALGTLNASKVISIPAAEWAEGNDAAQSWRGYRPLRGHDPVSLEVLPGKHACAWRNTNSSMISEG